MHAIKATWTNGRILPSEPVNWPEGSELLVEPVGKSDKIGLDESEWRDDPESIAAWIAAVEKIQPMVWAEGEREEYELPPASSAIQYRGRSKTNGSHARR